MTSATHLRERRSRRLVVLGGALALLGLFAIGAAVVEPQIEDDLATRVPVALAQQGHVVTANFSGQDGTLQCAAPLADPTAARRLALDVYGVHAIELDPSCGVDGAPPATTTTTVAPTTVPVTSPPSTLAPTTTVAASTTTTAPVAPQVAVQFVDGTLVLNGSVNSDLVRLAVLERVRTVVAPENVIDQMVVEAGAAEVPAERLTALLNLTALMPSTLSAGQVGWDGTGITATGSFVDELGRASFQSAADNVGATATLTPRPAATPEQAATLEFELNALVAAQPILFDKGSTTISAASQATVQRIAGIAKRYAGMQIEVQGHTDSEGDPARNLTLSEQRAGAVRDALVALGVPATDLTAKGFGITELVRDEAGNEIPEKSRRVVFGVVLV